jgi:hypothetical protein
VAYVPEGTAAVITPQTGIFYAPVGAGAIISGPLYHSERVRAADGSMMEIDSDNTVYKVFADGSKVSAEDGIHTMADGNSITVRNGQRIP